MRGGGVSHPRTGILIKRGRCGPRHSGVKVLRRWGQGVSEASTNQGAAEVADQHHEPGEAKGESFLRVFEEGMALRHLDFGLVASRTGRT